MLSLVTEEQKACYILHYMLQYYHDIIQLVKPSTADDPNSTMLQTN